MKDITAPREVEIRIRADGQVIWINVDGKCELRCSAIKKIYLEDEREKNLLESNKE